MEARLLPVNALVALCHSGGPYPSTLHDAGYALTGLEIPASTEHGTVVIDVLIFNATSNNFLAGEAKSGSNIEDGQAVSYKVLNPETVVRAGSVTVKSTGDLNLQPVYCCLASNVDGIVLGLKQAGLACPVLAVGKSAMLHHGANFDDANLQNIWSSPVAAPHGPPRIINVDSDSPDAEFFRLVSTTLVAETSRGTPEISIPALAERTLKHLLIYGKSARNALTKKIDSAARDIAEKEPDRYEYLPRTGNREFAVVKILRSPEDLTPQGRTQSYQSLRRSLDTELGSDRGQQMTLFDDLIDEEEALTSWDED